MPGSLVLLAVAVLVLVPSGEAHADDLREIEARGTLRAIVFPGVQPEMFALEARVAPGFERELVEGYAALHRLKLELVEVPTAADRVPALLAGKGDLVAGAINATPARRKLVDFSLQVLPARHVVVTYAPHAPVTTLAQLRAQRVSTVRGSSWQDEVEAARVPPGAVLAFESPEEALAALRDGRATAIVLSVTWAVIEQKRDARLEMGLFLGAELDQAWALRHDSPALRQSIDEYLANVRRSPRWSYLVVKYFGDRALETLKKSKTTE